jgi:hypothetical protein
MIDAKTIITFEDYKRWLRAVSDNSATDEGFQLLSVSDRQSIADIVKRWDDEANAEYEKRVNDLEAEGLTRSDAQAIVDAEDLQRKAGVK